MSESKPIEVGSVILRYRLKGDSEVHSRTISREEAEHFSLRLWLLPYCDFAEFSNTNRTTETAPVRQEFLFKHKEPVLEPASLSAPARLIRRKEDAFSMPLICARSGIALGKFVPSTGLAVASPYVQHWKQSTFLHPIFSFSLADLIHKANACWQLEKSGTRSFPMQHKQLLFLAMLHASGCIKQDVPCLPAPKQVETHFSRLIEMLSWKYETASERVSFPKLHVWKGAGREDEHNPFANLAIWLDVVEACKEEYENIARTRMKEARRKAHDMAMKSIKRAMYADVSLRRLWGWFTAQVPQVIVENNADLEQLFFAEEQKISVWTAPDIEALETIFLKYCELGSSVSHEFNKRINQLKEWLNIYNDTFEIVTDSERYAEHKGQDAPRPENFSSRAAYLIAQAKWQLANKSVADVSKPAQQKKEKGADL